MSLEISAEPTYALEDASSQELEAAWKHCAAITRRAAGNFYYAFLFLPPEKRRGIYALYAFLRAGDDATDDDHVDSRGILQRLQHRLDLVFAGRYNDRLTLALAYAHRQFQFMRVHFEDMFLGLEMDLQPTIYHSFADLKLYCYRVASTVGLLCLRIFGVDTEDARKYAENLGIAMQLTNILRDIVEDYERGRIYLPVEDIERFKLSREHLLSAEYHQQLVNLVRWEGSRAHEYYQLADSLMPLKHKRKLVASKIMGIIYRTILKKIMVNDRFDKRVELTRREKLTIARKVVQEFSS